MEQMKQNNPVTNRPTGNVIRCRRSIIPFLLLIIATCMPDTAWGQAPGTQFTDANSGLKFEVLSTPANSVKVIGNSYSNTSYTIPVTVSDQGNTYDVVEIGEDAFFKCSGLKSVTFAQGSKVETIGKNAFFQCSNLTSVTIPSSVTTIGIQAFKNCGLTSVTIPNGVTTIENSAFHSCYDLTSVIIPSSVTTIEEATFFNCGLTSVTIPNSVTTIGSEVFYSCSNLTSVTIPSSVTTIGYEAFKECSNLASVTFQGDAPTFGNNVFDNTSNGLVIHVPAGKEEAYRNALNGKLPSSATIVEAKVPTPPVYYSWYRVTVPQVEGITFIRNNKEHDSFSIDVLEGSTFSFYIKPAEGLNPQDITVTTSRGETIMPDKKTGRYIIRNINEDVTVHVLTTPTANEPVIPDGIRLYTAGSCLYIDAPQQQAVKIYTASGALVYNGTLQAGSNAIPLPGGVHLVVFRNGAVKKVSL
ncbi:leucine-rich repeat domain-containing protein [Bacteroides sp. AM07-16]|uniref:leucine-rich repeat domain-containing protein n=1 Tax=Parabacteroides bouchesdurhonensis TaxID=1936995 RepID=UPI000E4AD911|nr:leucine-rich repeat domain-containing protein [Parabacteroides bouchesdurhonensis]RHJ93455.1 leucine-rich repeat domain-containing protein [Bacteroides sp. AM07-16]